MKQNLNLRENKRKWWKCTIQLMKVYFGFDGVSSHPPPSSSSDKTNYTELCFFEAATTSKALIIFLGANNPREKPSSANPIESYES